MSLTGLSKCSQWVYLIQCPDQDRELGIEEYEIIENADGEVDVPLDSVLRRYNMSVEDLVYMKACQISLIEIKQDTREILRTIPYKYLKYYGSTLEMN